LIGYQSFELLPVDVLLCGFAFTPDLDRPPIISVLRGRSARHEIPQGPLANPSSGSLVGRRKPFDQAAGQVVCQPERLPSALAPRMFVLVESLLSAQARQACGQLPTM